MRYIWLDDYLMARPGVTKDFKPEWNWIRYQIGGKLFAATDGDRTEYCSREYEKGKTCREVGASRIYQKKLLGNPITRAYNRAYKTHNARIRYGTMTREEFKAWTEEAKKHRDACQAGEISLERFEEWLKD